MENFLQENNAIVEGSNTLSLRENLPVVITSVAEIDRTSNKESVYHLINSRCDTTGSGSETDSSNNNDQNVASRKFDYQKMPSVSSPIPFTSAFVSQLTALEQNGTVVERRSSLRRGRWSPEELEYANAVIGNFKVGLLTIPPNVTLRSYISEKLKCEPTRIIKKYPGVAFLSTTHSDNQLSQHNYWSLNEKEQAMKVLDQLEIQFLKSIEPKDKQISGILSKMKRPDVTCRSQVETCRVKCEPPRFREQSSSSVKYKNAAANMNAAVNLSLTQMSTQIELPRTVSPATAMSDPAIFNSSRSSIIPKNGGTKESCPSESQLDMVLSSLLELSKTAGHLGPMIAQVVSLLKSSRQKAAENSCDPDEMRLNQQQQSDLCLLLSQYILTNVSNGNSSLTSSPNEEIKEKSHLTQQQGVVELQAHQTDDLCNSPLEQNNLKLAEYYSARLKDVYSHVLPGKASNGHEDGDAIKQLQGRLGHIVIQPEHHIRSFDSLSHTSIGFPGQSSGQHQTQRYLVELRKNYDATLQERKLAVKEENTLNNEEALSLHDKFDGRSKGEKEVRVGAKDSENKLFYLASIAALAEENMGSDENCVTACDEGSDEEEYKCKPKNFYEDTPYHCVSPGSDSSRYEAVGKRPVTESEMPFRKRLRHQ